MQQIRYSAYMILVVGLGNIGTKYANNRHNVGWMAVDAVAEKESLRFVSKSAFHADIAQTDEVLFAKPDTYMNESGKAVAKLVKQNPDALVAVVYDDIDINIGEIKCSFARGAGGHNGVQSVIDHLGHKDFFRIRIGVRPVHDELMARIAPPDGFEKFLLSDFAPFESELKKQGIDKAVAIIESLPTKTVEEVMNQWN
jgi:PTH1 family peptidyl-tRNA hydrolase